MINFRTLYTGLAILLLASCGQEEAGVEAPLPVGIAAAAVEGGVKTRGTEYSSAELPPSMGVFAFQTRGNYTDSGFETFMYNQTVNRSGSTWSYSPLKYWPSGEYRLSFFAYAPVSAKISPLWSSRSGGDMLSWIYTIPTAEEEQEDVLASVPLMNIQQGEGRVKFHFKHALARVIFRVKSYAEGITLKGLHMAIPQEPLRGRLTYATDGSSPGFQWKAEGTHKAGTFTAKTSSISIPSDGKEVNAAVFLLIPTLGSGVPGTFEISFLRRGTAAPVTERGSLPVPDRKWEPGATFIYTITINTSLNVEVNASYHTVPWEMGTETVQGGERLN